MCAYKGGDSLKQMAWARRIGGGPKSRERKVVDPGKYRITSTCGTQYLFSLHINKVIINNEKRAK